MAVWSLGILCGVALLAVKVDSGCELVKPVYTKGDCSVRISNWMVIGSCTVKSMYSSDNNYTCKWRISKNIEEFGGFQTTPTSYTEQNGRNYYKGVCSFAKPIPTFQSCYTYSMSLSPGGDDYFNERICTDKPYQVQLSHNCPGYVFEGSDVHCECNASRTISSPALLVWEGMDDSTLQLTNVSRRLNQRQFTCRLEWSPDGSIKETISYKLNVAYGPGDVLITETTTDESQTISVTCTATDVYPAAEIRWNITCYNQTDYGSSSTCFLNFTHNGESLVILCTVSNAHFPREYKSRVYVLSSIGIYIFLTISEFLSLVWSNQSNINIQFFCRCLNSIPV
ncbi:uncharacterized protein LOC112569528 isoform X2 [Pomacea canaliculata]|uniref:uncharacterized protein LOC112569528 isoform X2 n=1 Tax=Pomacea canaliculata TaxID=400727 RepID=UPI000D73BA9E|nr:uncharacterized protein LOC112569528 isoform X2 [Pomacea canaliculata]